MLFSCASSDLRTVRTLPAVLGFGAGLAIVQGVFDYTGGKFSGYEKDPSVDEYERKEYLKKNRRKPIQETLEQLGEGRGRSPLKRLKSGIDVPSQVSTVLVTERGERVGLRRAMASMYHGPDECIAWVIGVCGIVHI
jgi:hypothetical protein